MSMNQQYTDCLSELETVKAERDALAAHVERQNKIIFDTLSALDDGNLDDVPFDEAREVYNEAPQTSLARLKAQWQAEALVALADLWEEDSPCTVADEGGVAITIWTGWLRGRADELRSQAGGDV